MNIAIVESVGRSLVYNLFNVLYKSLKEIERE